MSKTISLAYFIGATFLFLYCLYWYKSGVSNYIMLEEYVLEKQVNHASDAAIDELLGSQDLEQSYLEGAIVVEPDIAVREFSTILARSFGYHITDETVESVRDKYVKVLLVCAWDGVYAYHTRQTESDGTGFVSSPKLPYYYTAYEGDTGRQTQYALTLGLESGYRDSFDGNSYSLEKYGKLSGSKDVQRTAINNRVSDILQWSLMEAYGGAERVAYSIPSYASQISGAQPVDGVTVIGVVDNSSITFAEDVIAMGVGGSKIEETDPIIGFIHSGTKYYIRQSKISKFENDKGTSVSAIETFTNVFDAARKGYHCLIDY